MSLPRRSALALFGLPLLALGAMLITLFSFQGSSHAICSTCDKCDLITYCGCCPDPEEGGFKGWENCTGRCNPAHCEVSCTCGEPVGPPEPGCGGY
jgi:hypothetical protein